MLYLNQHDIRRIGIDWKNITDIIRNTVTVMGTADYSQPVKLYLRYNEQVNRIIAMPAYVGGDVSVSGIKWIASFPGNIQHGMPRAHSVTILNNAGTGKPFCVINTNLISGVRTAGVSALILEQFLKSRVGAEPLNVGIIGFGPIGRLHAEMVNAIIGERMNRLCLYDLNGIDQQVAEGGKNITICHSWEAFFEESDVIITCTVADRPYINLLPKEGSLHLNVSLRDYLPGFRQHVDMMLVDDWEEVCREKTDIEIMHKECGLQRTDTYSIVDVVCGNILEKTPPDNVVMFNPMGMSVFDVSVGAYYYSKAVDMGLGVLLEN